MRTLLLFLAKSAKNTAPTPSSAARAFHEPMKFAHFYDTKSHRFDADPIVSDFALGVQATMQDKRPPSSTRSPARPFGRPRRCKTGSRYQAVEVVKQLGAEDPSKDDAKALEAYEAILAGKTRLGGADEYSTLQGVWKTNFAKSIDAVQQERK